MADLWDGIAGWWTSLWADPKIFGAAVGSLVTGLVLFLLNEAWKHRTTKDKTQREQAQGRLDEVYGPLYALYREAYARFESWKRDNPQSRIERQAFFDEERSESLAETILTTKAGYSSQRLMVLWTAHQAAGNRADKQRCKASFVKRLVQEYQVLRRDLELDYDQTELDTGEFSTH